jgi:signal transduction histidine kinase
LEEFGRLHDEAVQVLEQAARGTPPSAELRVYAARAAARLRADSGPEPASCSLLRALTRVADDFATLGFRVSVQQAMPSEATIGDRSRALLVSAVVEALNNPFKHSGADGATVRLATTASWVEVTVEDHGRGFDLRAVRPRFGLAGSIRRRGEEAGGTGLRRRRRVAVAAGLGPTRRRALAAAGCGPARAPRRSPATQSNGDSAARRPPGGGPRATMGR